MTRAQLALHRTVWAALLIIVPATLAFGMWMRWHGEHALNAEEARR